MCKTVHFLSYKNMVSLDFLNKPIKSKLGRPRSFGHPVYIVINYVNEVE